MKKIIFLVLFFLTINKINAQDRIGVKTSPAETFIETYSKNFSNDFVLQDAYRLGPSSSKTLKDGLKIAINWIELNLIHQKEFEKGICCFKAMNKEDYKFFGYNDHITVEMAMNFKGYSDGTFNLEIKVYNSFSTFILFEDKDDVIRFLDMLNGKSANKEIDDIFKRQ